MRFRTGNTQFTALITSIAMAYGLVSLSQDLRAMSSKS